MSETRQSGLTTTALDTAFTSALAGAALAAIAADGSLANSHDTQVEVLGLARDKLLDRSPLAELEARIGSKHQKIDEAMAANTARLTSVATQLNTLEQPDEYDTVNRLLEAQSQLEMHFTVTNRLAQLSFMNFMR